MISHGFSVRQLCSNSIVNPSAVAAAVPQPAASRRSINARRRAEQLMEALTGITCHGKIHGKSLWDDGKMLKRNKKTWMGQVESTHESRRILRLQYIQFMRTSTNISILLRSYFPLQKLNPWRPILPRNSPVHRSHPQCRGRPVAEGSLVSSSSP